ncbi:MAG: sulfatase [Planctomycetaceae bacterium]|nr:sulfatase [Planctomycetaceae bacterium]
MDKILLPLLLAFSLIGTVHRLDADDARPRPNFVLIIADDLGCDDTGPYGNRGIRTPSLDRLAASGLTFANAVLTCSSCSPSRSSIITCRYPHNTGAEQLHWPLPKEQTTFVELLKGAGYWTAAAGKWHLGKDVEDRFDLVKHAGRNNPSGCGEWVQVLKDRPQDKPFFLWLAAFDPHRDYAAGTISEPHSADDVTVPPYLPDTPEVRKDLAFYYDEINRLDGFVGQVLDELDRQKAADNTVMLFMTDNGRPFPRCKTTVYDSGVRTPLIVRWPAKIKPRTSTRSLVSSIDIGVTILDLAGVKPAASMQGQSFAAVLADPAAQSRTAAFSEHNWHDFEARSRSVRTESLKYIRNEYPDLPNTPPADAVRSPTFQTMRKLRDAGKLTPEQIVCFNKPLPAEELYDLESDPHELVNVAGQAKYQKDLESLRAALDRWKAETKDDAPAARTPDEFDREAGTPLPNRQGGRRPRR